MEKGYPIATWIWGQAHPHMQITNPSTNVICPWVTKALDPAFKIQFRSATAQGQQAGLEEKARIFRVRSRTSFVCCTLLFFFPVHQSRDPSCTITPAESNEQARVCIFRKSIPRNACKRHTIDICSLQN